MTVGIEITVGGRWLSLDCAYGDVEMTTEWPGGSGELSWALATPMAQRPRGGELVVAYCGGAPVWSGSLVEPDASQERMTAIGAWREGDNYIAFDGSGFPTTVPDTAIATAIAGGLKWTQYASISATAANLDVTQGPARVGSGVLDAFTEDTGQRWAVSPGRVLYTAADPTVPTYQTLRIDGGLGYALDNYASKLYGRYVSGAGPTYATTFWTDPVAESLHGHAEDIVDLTPKGVLSTGMAQLILANLLRLGRSTPQWTDSIELVFGELLTMGGTPVVLETVAAGSMVRVHGGFELAQRQNGAMYADIVIGQTTLSGGTLTLQPMQIASRTFTDTLTALMTKKK